MLRSVPTWPSRAGLEKPVTSVAGIVATVSPMSSAALLQPEPSVTRRVVVLDAGQAMDVGRRLRSDREGVGARVVEGVGLISHENEDTAPRSRRGRRARKSSAGSDRPRGADAEEWIPRP